MRGALQQLATKPIRRFASKAFQELKAEHPEGFTGGVSQRGVIAEACSATPRSSSHGLRRFIDMIAAALDDSRSGNLQRQNVLRTIAVPRDPFRKMEWSWAVLEVQDPAGSILASRGRSEQSAAVTYRKERPALVPPLNNSGSTGATGVGARVPVGVLIKREDKLKLDRRSARRGKGKGAKNGAQGEV